MIPEERIAVMREFIRVYGSANCWTGTLGTAATYISELLAEREERESEKL